MNSKIKQHFVPQFYLRNFSEHLYCFDKKTKKQFKTSPKNVAFERNFYSSENNNASDIENDFSKIEADHASSIKKLIESKNYYLLKDLDKVKICQFLAFMYNRTESTKNDLHKTIDSILNIVHKSKIPPELKLTHEDSVDSELQLSLLYESFKPFSYIFFNMKFVILENNTTIPFWTSDNPLTRDNNIDHAPFGTLGIGNSGIGIHLPITPKLSLLALDPIIYKSTPEKIQLYEQQVYQENLLQYVFSNRFLYSNLRKFNSITTMLKDYPNYQNESISSNFKVKYKDTIGILPTERNFHYPIDPNKPLLDEMKTWLSDDLINKIEHM